VSGVVDTIESGVVGDEVKQWGDISSGSHVGCGVVETVVVDEGVLQ